LFGFVDQPLLHFQLIDKAVREKEGVMALCIALRTLKKSPKDINNAYPDLAPKMAKAMAAGETFAKCIKTWNPLPYGRKDYVFCLWGDEKT
jgi:hypothetical protein